MSDADREPLVLRPSALERVIWCSPAIALPIGLAVGTAVSDDHPDTGAWAAFAIFELTFIFVALIAFRFVVRIDADELYHREIVTRSIPLSRVRRIRVARKKGPIARLSIEVLADDETRILIAWREGKMAPLLARLTDRFPDRIEVVDSLPEV